MRKKEKKIVFRFSKFYTNISSKLVGILIRARKHGYVEFDNERQALFQNQDDQVKITLVQMPKDC